MSKESKDVKVTKAKGRPMLSWIGKKPLSRVTAFPAQLVERFDPQKTIQPLAIPTYKENEHDWRNLLFHGDNKDVLAWLLANGYRGKVDLIYIDPPFDSGADYVRKVQLRGAGGRAKIDGESYTLGEQIQYTDIWSNDNYLQFMFERILLLKELLTKDGSIFLHTDWHKTHLLRCLLDEAFGPNSIRNEIVWYYPDKFATGGKSLDKNHDLILHYSESDNYTANEIRIPKGVKTRRALREKINGKTVDVLDSEGEKIVKEYSDKIIDDVWQIGRSIPNDKYTGYPTQKKDDLVFRILEYGSTPNSLVLDCFIGSGSTAYAAQFLGRRWIGCDINKGAVQTTSKRLQTLIEKQVKAKMNGRQLNHSEGEEETAPEPASLAFEVLRVNDYDLQIQHNEALNLVCEHVGVERIRTDSFFDGTRGKELVKIIPLNHPLSPLDLEEIKKELEARQTEQRDILVIALGKEFSVDAWLENWNRHKPINKIRVIELRTDKQYGKFFEHKPASGEVEITRKSDKILVEIKDFLSPTIVERLSMEESIFKAQITDFKAMIDCVMIDTAYNGEVFNVTLSDVPEKKADLVRGRYELPAPKGKTTVAVKIIDMLGEEVLKTKEV